MDLACEFGRYRVRAVCAYTVTVSASQMNKSLSLTESCPPFYISEVNSEIYCKHTTWSFTLWSHCPISGIMNGIYVVLSWNQDSN